MSANVFGAAVSEIEPFALDHDFTADDLDRFVLWARDTGASDLTIQAGDFVMGQIQGRWLKLTQRPLESNEVERIVSLKYGVSGPTILESGKPLDFRMEVVLDRDNVIGYRANATRGRIGPVARGISITARTIPGLPPKLDDLGLEAEVRENLFPRYGLVLVIGTTGSGKTTLLASHTRERLEARADHPTKIITYEDPVEYTFQRLGYGCMPLVSQVEIGRGADLETFDLAGPNAMRRKADVIIVGELRDRTSVMAGLEMAETGHAVYGTLHVETPAQAVDRIVSFFPVDGQPAAANKLRAALRLVVAQKLVENTSGTRTAFRSWVAFDRELKRQMGQVPFHQWETMLTEICEQRGGDFATRAAPALASGEITFDAFTELAGFTRGESLNYCKQRGIDVRELD